MRILALLLACTVAGCITITEPVQMSKDTYMIALGARGGFSTNAQLLTESLKKAQDFCAVKGLNVDVVKTQSHGLQGWTPQENQVVFRCLASDDPAYGRSNYQQPPDVIIEERHR